MNIGSFIAIQVATQAAASQSAVLNRLRERGADSETTAITLDPDCDEYAIASLLKRGHVREARPGMYYLGDPPDASEPRRALAIGVALLLMTLVVLVLFMLERTPAL